MTREELQTEVEKLNKLIAEKDAIIRQQADGSTGRSP